MKTRYGKTAVQQNKYYEVDNIYLYMIETYMNGNISQLRVFYKELIEKYTLEIKRQSQSI